MVGAFCGHLSAVQFKLQRSMLLLQTSCPKMLHQHTALEYAKPVHSQKPAGKI